MAQLFEIPNNESLYTEVIKNALDNRIIIINQDINDGLLEDVIMHILNWNIEDIGLPIDKRRRIVLIINSCGGDVYTGTNIQNIIEQSSTPIIGVAMGLVASAAYNIYLSCHIRVAFADTVLLMHDGSLTISDSSSKVKDFMRFSDEMEFRTKQHVLSHTKITSEFYDSHWDTEFYLYANTTGKELGIVDKIIGEDISLDEIFE